MAGVGGWLAGWLAGRTPPPLPRLARLHGIIPWPKPKKKDDPRWQAKYNDGHFCLVVSDGVNGSRCTEFFRSVVNFLDAVH